MLDTLLTLDGGFLLWLQNLRTPILNVLFSFYTQLGNAGLVWIVLSAAMLLHPRTRKAGFWALIAMLFGLLFTNVLLKHLVGRTRPWLVVEGLTALVDEHDPNSFPSGHTCAAFACCLTWARFAARRWVKVLCLVLAVLMGLSRLYVGVHFPSDVIAGCIVGCFCAFLAWAVQRKTENVWRGRKA